MMTAEEHKVRNLEAQIRYRATHQGVIRAYTATYYPIQHATYMKKKYGLTLAEYDELLARQGGKCAACGADNSGAVKKDGTYRSMYVDHDHATGRVRGLLCTSCNMALGYAHDDPELLLRLAAYLTRG